MADVKISQLPVATTPLTGTEEVPLVQSGATKQTTIADIVSKVGAVTAVTGTAPVVSSGGLTPAISMAAATGSVNGYLTSTDWTTFNNKQPAGSYLVNGGPLGTPSSGTATNLTGTASGLTAGNVTTNANLTGAVTSVGNATSLGSFTSAQLAAALTDETGSGANVFATSPTLVTPILGTPTSGNFSTGTFTWPTFNQNTSGTAAGLSTTLAIASGGTGQTTANAAFNALAPSQATNAGKYLTTDGSNTSWATNPLGTVTSVAATVPSFLSITGSPITTSGTLAFGLSGTALPTTSGGTNLTSFTANGVVYASSTSALATGSALTFDGSSLGIGGAATSRLMVKTTTDSGAVTNWGASQMTVNPSGGGTDTAFGVGVNTSTNDVYLYALAPSVAWRNMNYNAANHVYNISGSEQMRLTSTGLGIGTSSPAQKLNVNGIALFEGAAQGNIIIQKTGTNGVSLFSDAAGKLAFYDQNAGVTRLTLDSAGNLGLGVTPSAWTNGFKSYDIQGGSVASNGTGSVRFIQNAYFNASSWLYKTTSPASRYDQDTGGHYWFNAPSGTAGNAITFSQAMTLDASGNLLVGSTSQFGGADCKLQGKNGSSAQAVSFLWNATTTGDANFVAFGTEASITQRGSIAYNRAGGLTVYNTTSDYRAKDISGPVTDSGALIDSTPVYMGKMKGATQERPMFIAHETPAYAHTGEKDAVDADGKPVYQQMDASALIPVMWAEIQSLRKRLAAANI